MSADPETARFLDGPRLVEFLGEHGFVPSTPCEGESMVRIVKEWRKGRRAHVYAADRVLVTAGLHLSELPDDLWLEDSRTVEAA